jgi:hypothetical protein
VINVLADNALVNGFAAEQRPVASHLVAEVCRDFDIAHVAAESSAADEVVEQVVAASVQHETPRESMLAMERVSAQPDAGRADVQPAEPVTAVQGLRAKLSFFQTARNK